MKKISDPLYLGAITGVVCSAVKEPLARYLINKRLTPYDGIQKSAGLVLEPYEIHKPAGVAVGILMDTIIGGTSATLLSILHTRGVYKVTPSKGILYGLGIWATWYGVLGGLSEYPRTTSSGALCSAGWHCVYGAVAGFLIQYLGEYPRKTEHDSKTEVYKDSVTETALNTPDEMQIL